MQGLVARRSVAVCWQSSVIGKRGFIQSAGRLAGWRTEVWTSRRGLRSTPIRRSDAERSSQKAVDFVASLGYQSGVAEGVVRALKDSGVSASGLLASVKQLAGRWEVGEDAGLEQLADAVEAELAKQQDLAVVRIKVVPPGGAETRAFTCAGYEGMSLTDIVKKGTDEGAAMLGEYIECACAGVMACSTCQVVVHPDWFDKVGTPDEPEQDMLDLAHEPQETSRLGCQIKLRRELDGMIVTIPGGTNNLMDFIDPQFRD